MSASRGLMAVLTASILLGIIRPASADSSIKPPFASYHAEDCVHGKRLIFDNSCQAIAWDRPTGNIRLNMAIGAPDGVPVSGQAFGWAGMVASHDLSSAAQTLTVTGTLQINYANVSRYTEYPILPDRDAGGRAYISLEIQHQDQPDCSGLADVTILDFQQGASTYPSGSVTLSASLQGCGTQIDPGRITINVQANADAHFFDDFIGDTGSIQTVLDLDVQGLDVHVT